MGIFNALNKYFKDNWCSSCKAEMPAISQQLYWMPVSVGHYKSHKDAEFFLKNLGPVADKGDIPIGYYACRAKMYRCPGCGQRIAVLTVFLPVRDQEKFEETVFFKNGEVDSLPGLFC